MKIAFVTNPFKVEPLGIAYLSASLKKAGHETFLVKNDRHTESIIGDIEPDIIAYSCTTGQHKSYLEVNKRLKQKYNFTSVFGGAHPTCFPEMINEDGVDIIFQGESDTSFVEWCDRIRRIDNVRMPKIIVPPATLCQNLDELPFPDREFLYTFPENRNNPIKNVMASRGCPHSCCYCYNSFYKDLYKGQRYVRYRSPQNVIDEIKGLIAKYPVELIFFQDDEFLMNPHFEELLSAYKKDIHVPFHCQIRIENLDILKARLLKEAGCTGVTFAIESGNEDYRIHRLKRHMTNETIVEGAKILRFHGIKIRTENMVGLPQETVDMMMETVKLNSYCKPTVAWTSIFQPYPKLPLSNGVENTGNFDSDFFNTTQMVTPIKKQIVNIQRLFGIACNYRLIHMFLMWLVKAPNNKLFDNIGSWWKQKQYEKLFT